MSNTTLSVERAAPLSSHAFYRAVWRWHFYAGALLIANAPMRPKSDVPKPKDPHAQCRQ